MGFAANWGFIWSRGLGVSNVGRFTTSPKRPHGESMNLGGIPGVFFRMICRSNDGKLRKDWTGFLNQKHGLETVICRGLFVGGIFVSGPSLQYP